MVAVGILFGSWPLIMQRSGLTGSTSTLVFAVIAVLFVLPVALKSGIAVEGTIWWIAIAASACGAIGLLLFMSGAAQSLPTNVGRMILIMTLFQLAAPAVYHVVVNQGLSPKTAIGFIATAIAAFCLV